MSSTIPPTTTLQAQAQAEAAASAARIKDLEEQLRDLMFALEAQQLVGAGGELQGGTLLPVPAPADPGPSQQQRRGKGAGRRK